MGCAVPARETSACRAFVTAGIAANAAAPAAAPFRNLRRSIVSFLDFRIVVSVDSRGDFIHPDGFLSELSPYASAIGVSSALRFQTRTFGHIEGFVWKCLRPASCRRSTSHTNTSHATHASRIHSDIWGRLHRGFRGGEKMWPKTGNANLPIGGLLDAIQENGVPGRHRDRRLYPSDAADESSGVGL